MKPVSYERFLEVQQRRARVFAALTGGSCQAELRTIEPTNNPETPESDGLVGQVSELEASEPSGVDDPPPPAATRSVRSPRV